MKPNMRMAASLLGHVRRLSGSSFTVAVPKEDCAPGVAVGAVSRVGSAAGDGAMVGEGGSGIGDGVSKAGRALGLAVGGTGVAVRVGMAVGAGAAGVAVIAAVRATNRTVGVSNFLVGVLDGSGVQFVGEVPSWLPDAIGISAPTRTAKISAPIVRIKLVCCSPKRI
jgi:hypothetical protein